MVLQTSLAAPIQRLETAIADRQSRGQRVPQSWFDRLEELRKGMARPPEPVEKSPEPRRDEVICPPADQPQAPPSIAEVQAKTKALAERIDRGRSWLLAHPTDVRAVRTDEPAVRDDGGWRALTPRGEWILRGYRAMVRAHRNGVRIMACDHLIRQAEKTRKDDECATLINEMAELWSCWETALTDLEIAERTLA